MGEGPANTYRYPEGLRRASDYEAGDREDRSREWLGARERIQMAEASRYADGGHVKQLTAEALIQYWDSCSMEILCLVEGIDAGTSATIQARHSYTRLDLAFNHDFMPCVEADAGIGACTIDFCKFHQLVQIRDRSMLEG